MKLRRLAWLAAPLVAAGVVFGFLCSRAGWDARYVARVLWHRDASTDDLAWKRRVPIATPSPTPWPARDDGARVRAAFAAGGVADLERYLTDGGALGLVVVECGTLAYEWYGNGGARDRPAMAFSVSKTAIAALVARAVDAGELRYTDAITTYVPALGARDPRFGAITIADLLDMRSGLAFDDAVGFPWVDADPPSVYYASDLAATAVARARIEAPPGARFVYNDYAPNLVGLALAAATHRALADGPMPALWGALGAEGPTAWLVDDRGFAWHESGLLATARDLARLGARALGDDTFARRTREPAGREVATTFGGVAVGYRNGWWIVGDHAAAAMGHYGQIIAVSWKTGVVIARLGRDGHEAEESNVALARRFVAVADRLE